MKIVNQPFQGQLGNILIDEISKPEYEELLIFSAFAKNSGILRMKNSFEEFRKKGGKIKAFIGIDLDGTSYEALINLFYLCDELYIIHTENSSITYHSKIYILRSYKNSRNWFAIGSNNLTSGGLWTNYESCCTGVFEDDGIDFSSIEELLKIYEDKSNKCSLQIQSEEQIEELLNNKYLKKEIQIRLQTGVKNSKENKEKSNLIKFFGNDKIKLPKIVAEKEKSEPKEKAITEIKKENETSNQIFISSENERFWFEMRKSTGGSKNILDLSKEGTIQSGTANNTIYAKDDESKMYGGVKFFDIDPENTMIEKEITINYKGRDYYPSTIKFTPDNGSWRIQLKGDPKDGTEPLSKHGNKQEFVNKILIFEKINTNYFALSLIEDSELDIIKTQSRVWAVNGNNPNSKAYGMLL